MSKIFAIIGLILGILFSFLCYNVEAGDVPDQQFMRYGSGIKYRHPLHKPIHKLPYRKWWGEKRKHHRRNNTNYSSVIREPIVIVINQPAPIVPPPPAPKYEVIYTWVPEKREKIRVPSGWDCAVKKEWVAGHWKFSTDHSICHQVPEHDEFQVVQEGYYTEKRVRID